MPQIRRKRRHRSESGRTAPVRGELAHILPLQTHHTELLEQIGVDGDLPRFNALCGDILMKITGLSVAFATATAMACPLSATTIDFTEVPLPTLTLVSSQYATYGIGAGNLYYYIDGRDTFDARGLAAFDLNAFITFTAPVNNLSIDFLALRDNGFQLTTYDAADAPLEVFSFGALSTDFNGTHDFASGGIAKLVLTSPISFVGLSTLRFEVATSAVPEPASWAMLVTGFALAGAALRRRAAIRFA
jgi:hypothetical protein